MQSPEILKDEDIRMVGQKYGIEDINANDVTQYKLCQVIRWLERRLDEK